MAGFKGQTGKLLLFAGLAGVAFWLWRRGGMGVSGKGTLAPAVVGANEQVRAGSYRVIKNRRPGLLYVKVEKGNIGGELSFKAPVKGKFTRNVIVEATGIFAEIAA